MKRSIILIIIITLSTFASAQLKQQSGQPDIGEALKSAPGNMLFGFIDPSKIQMRHSFSSSFLSGGGNSLMLNSYINSIDYQFSAPLLLRLNLGVMNSPYSSFNHSGNYRIPALDKASFFGSAELEYRPTANTRLHLGVGYAPNLYQSITNPLGIRR